MNIRQTLAQSRLAWRLVALTALLLVALTFTPPPAIAQSPPAAPTGLSASGGVHSVTLSWSDPSDSSITHYEYNLNHNDTSTGNLSGWGPWTSIPGSGASTTSHTFTGLTPGREYRYHLRAVNSGGPSVGAPASGPPWFVSASPSAPAPKPPKPKPPAAPTGLSASAGVRSVTLSWNDPSDSSITRYEYNVNHNDTSTGNLSGWGPWTSIPGSGASTTSHTFTGLTPGREYRYHVRAVNGDGPSVGAPNAAPWFVSASPSAPAPKPTPTPTPKPNPPAAPTGLTATAGNGSVTLSWNDPSDSSIIGYEYNLNHNDTSTGNLSGWGRWTYIPGSGASTTSHTFTGLTNGREYRYHLRAVNGGGPSVGAPNAAPWFVKAVPAIPVLAPPGNLSVTPGDGYLDIYWDAVSGATAYDIRAKEAGASDWHSVANKITATSYRYTTGKTIDYVAVRARNANAVGPWAELSRMPGHDWLNTVQSSGGASIASAQSQSQLAAPTFGTITRDNARDEKLHVSWAAVTGASGYNLACSDVDGWSWWQCGSTTSATNLTVDDGPRGDLHSERKYMVSVRAVTSDPADASDWKRSENIYPAFAQLRNLTHSRSGGSVTLSWTPNFYTTGYEIDCAVSGSSYTRCATLTGQDDSAAQHSVTISTWTGGGATYNVDDGASYDIKITSTNQWGKSATSMRAPLIGPIPNVSNLGQASDTFGQKVDSSNIVATGFRTGTNSGGYTLQGVTLGFLTPTYTTGAPSAWQFTLRRAATRPRRRPTPSLTSTATLPQPETPPTPVPGLAACWPIRPISWCCRQLPAPPTSWIRRLETTRPTHPTSAGASTMG